MIDPRMQRATKDFFHKMNMNSCDLSKRMQLYVRESTVAILGVITCNASYYQRGVGT